MMRKFIHGFRSYIIKGKQGFLLSLFYASEAALTECASEELCPNTTIDKYTDAEKSAAVWFTLIGGGHHAWPVSSDSGFNANDLILDFFNTIGENAP